MTDTNASGENEMGKTCKHSLTIEDDAQVMICDQCGMADYEVELAAAQKRIKELEDQAKKDWNGSIIQRQNKEIFQLTSENERLSSIVDEYACHNRDCILNRLEQGEPTKDGGYRQMFAGRWYQSRPVDETPKCNCGFEEALKGKAVPPASEGDK